MIIVVIAGIILAVVMFKLLLPLLGEMVGVIIGGLLLLGEWRQKHCLSNSSIRASSMKR